MRVARMTLELLRPVPVQPLSVVTRTVRPGRKVQLIETSIVVQEQPLCRMRALRIRSEPVDVPHVGRDEVPAPPESAHSSGLDGEWHWSGFHDAVELRYVKGTFRTPGPATVWVRLPVPVVPGEDPSALSRVGAAADFGNGVSSELSWEEHMFINPDLTIYLHRPPDGEWVCIDAATHYGHDGIALAESALYDRHGRIGRSVQGLLVEAR